MSVPDHPTAQLSFLLFFIIKTKQRVGSIDVLTFQQRWTRYPSKIFLSFIATEPIDTIATNTNDSNTLLPSSGVQDTGLATERGSVFYPRGRFVFSLLLSS